MERKTGQEIRRKVRATIKTDPEKEGSLASQDLSGQTLGAMSQAEEEQRLIDA